MANYAVVKKGAVENIIAWDGETEFFVDGATLVVADSNTRIGGTYDGSFHYVEPPVPEPTAEQVAAAGVRESVIAKLKSLGLNDAEVAAIIGAA